MTAREISGLRLARLADALAQELAIDKEEMARRVAKLRMGVTLRGLRYTPSQSYVGQALDWPRTTDFWACCTVLGWDPARVAQLVRWAARRAMSAGRVRDDGQPRQRHHRDARTGDLFGEVENG